MEDTVFPARRMVNRNAGKTTVASSEVYNWHLGKGDRGLAMLSFRRTVRNRDRCGDTSDRLVSYGCLAYQQPPFTTTPQTLQTARLHHGNTCGDGAKPVSLRRRATRVGMTPPWPQNVTVAALFVGS
ncbi:hypothetical protein CcaCcLH18_12124 [Colletotrichum camelliae]|nr:hypothetical protein CcaCcLH18_12124 [Colletotrichum camelliae]